MFVADPRAVLAINIPPRITTPLKELLVLMSGLKRAGSTFQMRKYPKNPARIK
jgi:hypothetical protein